MATNPTEKPNRRKRRRGSRFTTMLILLGAIVVLGVSTLVLRSTYHAMTKEAAPSEAERADAAEKQNGLFNIQEITVSGNTRYLPEAIVQVSGLYKGESVWSVDKTAAAQKILATFPYIEAATVKNTAYNKLDIAVTETRQIGVMYAGGHWVAVGANGKVLETQPITSDRPLRAHYFKGATVNSATLGEQAMDARSFAIVTELLGALEQYRLEDIREIDLENKSDIRLTLGNRIVIRLGNDSNLTHEIGVVASALPGIEAQYGSRAAGVLDVSAFSEENAVARAVFTPQELLTPATTTTSTETTTAAGSTTTAALR